jgi:hypothetical protein
VFVFLQSVPSLARFAFSSLSSLLADLDVQSGARGMPVNQESALIGA